MPPPGQRRLFTIYFGRLIAVFLVMWIPTILFIFILSPWLPQWVDFVGGSWSHLQGGVSACLILMKPDIKDAFRNFMTCRCEVGKNEDDEENSTRPSSSRRSSFGSRGSYLWPRNESGDSPKRRSSANFEPLDFELGLEDDLDDDIECGMEECTLDEKNGSDESDPDNECSNMNMKKESTPELCEYGDHVMP